MITLFDNFLFEFNRKDINLLYSKEVSENFTIAFELEMECDDPEIDPIKHEKDLIKELRNRLFTVLKQEEVDYSEKIFFIEEITIACDFDDDDETLDNVLDPDLYEDETEKLIAFYLTTLYEEMFEEVQEEEEKNSYERSYLGYLIKKVKLHLPNLWKKYKANLDCVLDMTLDKGIEVKQKTYIKGLENAIIFLNDFFNDFNNQDYWKFSKKTGLHINIGYDKKGVKWNTLKGMMLLKDLKKDDIPFVYKDMIWRMNTDFTDSIFNKLEIDRSKIDLTNIKSVETYINNAIKKIIKKFGAKHFAFNITKLQKEKYIEFRYVGGVVNEELIVSKMLYFCYIIYIMTTPEYKRREYLKALYKFVNE